MVADSMTDAKTEHEPEEKPPNEAIICPVCGEVAVQEKCKIICRSETCRGRIIMNCSEF